MSGTDTRWINETASRYGIGGDPNVHAMMQVAIDHERERCVKIVERPLYDPEEAAKLGDYGYRNALRKAADAIRAGLSDRR